MLNDMWALLGKRSLPARIAVSLCAIVSHIAWTWTMYGGPVAGEMSPGPPEALGNYQVGKFVVSFDEEPDGPVPDISVVFV